MNFKEIKDLIDFIKKSDLSEVEIEHNDFKLRVLRKAPETSVVYSAPPPPAYVPPVAPAVTAQPVADVPKAEAPKTEAKAENQHTFRSPMIGTFYSAATPNDPPFVKVGQTVKKGEKLCIIEAMKIYNEIESDVTGTIVKVLIDNAKPVEYDQPLFLIEQA